MATGRSPLFDYVRDCEPWERASRLPSDEAIEAVGIGESEDICSDEDCVVMRRGLYRAIADAWLEARK